MDEKNLLIKLRFALDQGDLEKAKKATADLDKQMASGKGVEANRKNFQAMRENAEKLQQIGITMAATGAAIMAPMVLAARAYVQAAGSADDTSRQWLTTTRELEVSQQRVGKVVAQQMLPYLKDAAGFSNQIANAVSKSPMLVQAAFMVGSSMVGDGGLLTAGAQVMRTVGGVGMLLGGVNSGATALGMGGLAGIRAGVAGGLAAGGPIAIATILGGLLGLGGNELLSRVPGSQAQPTSHVAIAGMDVMGNLFNKITGGGAAGDIKTKQADLALAALFGIIDKGTAAATSAAMAEQRLKAEREQTASGWKNDQGAKSMFIQYQRQLNDLDQQTGRERARINTETNRQLAQIDRDYGMQRAMAERNFATQQAQEAQDYSINMVRQARDFHTQEQRNEQQYYQQRRITARNYNIETQRMEEDHQRAQARSAWQHNYQMMDLLDSRDAMGIVNEQRSYEYDRKMAEEDYQIQVSRRNEDYGLQLKDAEQQYAQEKALRMQDYEQRQSDQAADLKLRQDREKQAFETSLADMKTQHEQQETQLNTQRTQTLALLDQTYATEKAKINDAFLDQLYTMGYYNSQLADSFYGAMESRYAVFMANVDTMTSSYMQQMTASQSTSTPGAGDYGNFNPSSHNAPSKYYIPANHRAMGGYTAGGYYMMHDHEFVLSPSTTKAAERLARGALSQESALAAMAGGRNLTYNDHRRFDSRLSAEDRRAIRSDTEAMFKDLLQ